MRRGLASVLTMALCLFLCAPAWANKRVALIIGVNAYQSLSPLSNPVPDAHAIATALKRYGFAVTEHYDLDRAAMLDALENFSLESGQADVALVYYAGHGMEIAGKNILAPKDMEIDCEKKLPRRSVDLDQLFDAIAGAPKQVVLLDSCRNDPFPQCPSRSAGSGAGFRGIARAGGEGRSLLIANATLSGQLAADGSPGQNSPFAKALLARFETDPHLQLRDLLDMASQDVSVSSRGTQVPEVLTRGGAPRICLDESRCGERQANIQPQAQPEAQPEPHGQLLPSPKSFAAIDPGMLAAKAWEDAKGSNNRTVLEAFVNRHKDSFYSELAAARLRELASSEKTHNCVGPRTIFEDPFDTYDPKWGWESASLKAIGGRFIIELAPHKLDFAVNQDSYYDDAEICVTYTYADGKIPDQAWAGVMFWYTDPKNLYAFALSPLGTTAIWRLVDNNWNQLGDWEQNSAIRTGPGSSNNIRVVTKGSKATLFVNDVEIRSFTGEPPADGQLVGLIGEALEKSDAVTHAFDNFTVSTP